MAFDEERHAYSVDGERVRASVTALVACAFPVEERFDADRVIDKNLSGWRGNPSSKYHQVVLNKSDAEAKRAIRAEWDAARDSGVLLHKAIERALDGAGGDPVPSVSPLELDSVLQALRELRADEWEPYRVELPVFWERSGRVTCCGMIDLVLVRRDDRSRFAIVDYKRSDKDLSPDARAYGKTAIGPLEGRSATPHLSYSIQQSMYRAMLLQRLGDDRATVEWCKLVQQRPGASSANVVECEDLVVEARGMLDSAVELLSERDEQIRSAGSKRKKGDCP